MNLQQALLFTKNVEFKYDDGTKDVVKVYYDRTQPDNEKSYQPVNDVLSILVGNSSAGIEGFSQWLSKKGYSQILDIWNKFTITPIYEWHEVKRINEKGEVFVIQEPNTASTWHGVIFINPNFMMNTLFDGTNYWGENPTEQYKKVHPMKPGTYYTTKESFEANGIPWTEETGYLCVYYVLLHEIFHNVHGDIFDWEQLNKKKKNSNEYEYQDVKYNKIDTANIAMDFYCNWNVEFFFPEMKGFGKALGFYTEDNPRYSGFGTSGWMTNYDALERMKKEEQKDNQEPEEEDYEEYIKSDEYKEGYNDMCDSISSIIDSEFDDVSDKDAILNRLTDEYRDVFDNAGINIDDLINEALNESSIVLKGGDYNQGSIDAFKDWVKYIKKKAEEDKQNQAQQGNQGNQGDQGQEGQGGDQSGDDGDGSGDDGNNPGDGSGDGQDGNPGDGNGDGSGEGEGGHGDGNGDGPGDGNNPGQGSGRNGKPSNSNNPSGQGTGDNNGFNQPGNNGNPSVNGQKSNNPSDKEFTDYDKYYQEGWDEIINASI